MKQKKLETRISVVKIYEGRYRILDLGYKERMVIKELASAARVQVFHSDDRTDLIGKLDTIKGKLARVGIIIDKVIR